MSDVVICVTTLYKHAVHAVTAEERRTLMESVVIMSSDTKDNLVVNYCAGMAMAMLSRHDEAALERFDKVLAVQPCNVEMLTKRSQCLLYMKRYCDALKDMDSVVRLCPGNIAARLMHGFCMILCSKYQDALADFTRILEMEPRNEEALMGSATCLLRLNQIFEAKAVYEKLLEVQPNNAIAKQQHAKCVLECDVAAALLSLLNESA